MYLGPATQADHGQHNLLYFKEKKKLKERNKARMKEQRANKTEVFRDRQTPQLVN
jgi:hypothetical protein